MKVPVIYLRVSPVLKRDVQRAAAESGMSVNQWMQQCLERGLTDKVSLNKIRRVCDHLHEIETVLNT